MGKKDPHRPYSFPRESISSYVRQLTIRQYLAPVAAVFILFGTAPFSFFRKAFINIGGSTTPHGVESGDFGDYSNLTAVSHLSLHESQTKHGVASDEVTDNEMKTPQKIHYEETPSGRSDVKRYIAMQVSTLSQSKEPVSIRAWMKLVSSRDVYSDGSMRDGEESNVADDVGISAIIDLSTIIANSQYPSILFETPGSSWSKSEDTPFEFAMVNKPALQTFAENYPDRGAFDEHFRKCMKSQTDQGNNKAVCCAFENLGGDARLVSPLPSNGVNDTAYSHLAAFARKAPQHQIIEFWRLGARQYLNLLKEKDERWGEGEKTWFSTNGMGVAWLHLRLDDRPKYYSYVPFAQ